MISVADVWHGALPEGTTLLAGAGGLEHSVEWVTALRSRPPAFEAIKGGELAFVPVASLRLLDERLTLAAVLSSLAERGGVAVAVAGEVSDESLALADEIGLPLLCLPAAVQVADAHAAAVRFILDRRTRLHEHRQLLHAELTELALAGAGVAAIVDRLAALTGGTAAWLDPTARPRHRAGPQGGPPARDPEQERPDRQKRPARQAGEPQEAGAAAEVAAMLRWADTVPLLAADPPVRDLPGRGPRVVSPIPGRDGVAGFVVLEGAGLDQQLARVSVSRAAAACAIDLDRERAVLRTREELEGGLLDSLLSGAHASEEWVRERLGRLGSAVAEGPVVLCLRADGHGVAAETDGLIRSVRGWLSRRAPDALVVARHGEVVVLAGAADDQRALREAQELQAAVAPSLAPRTVSVGVGGARTGIAGVPASYREARRALQLGSRLLGPGRVTPFGGLGLHRLLLALSGQPELEEFYRGNVGRLVDYDQRTRSGLMSTLEAFFACHGSPTEMAVRLGLHRNTVLYRLRRISEVGGVDLANPDTRLSLHLCLRIREVLAAEAGIPAA